MPRPPKCRCVELMPGVTFFQPRGVPLGRLQEVCLAIEEREAIRLKDLEELEQEECAERMHVSHATFQRVLESARRKIAEAIINGKAIHVDGGNFEMAINYNTTLTCPYLLGPHFGSSKLGVGKLEKG